MAPQPLLGFRRCLLRCAQLVKTVNRTGLCVPRAASEIATSAPGPIAVGGLRRCFRWPWLQQLNRGGLS